MSDNNYSYKGKLDEETLIFRHIDRLSRLSTKLENLEESNWALYAQRFVFGIHTFEGLVSPILDDTFQERKQEIREEYADNEGKKIREWEKRINYSRELFKEIIKLLFRNNVYWGEESNVVIDQTKEGEDEAFTID